MEFSKMHFFTVFLCRVFNIPSSDTPAGVPFLYNFLIGNYFWSIKHESLLQQ